MLTVVLVACSSAQKASPETTTAPTTTLQAPTTTAASAPTHVMVGRMSVDEPATYAGMTEGQPCEGIGDIQSDLWAVVLTTGDKELARQALGVGRIDEDGGCAFNVSFPGIPELADGYRVRTELMDPTLAAFFSLVNMQTFGWNIGLTAWPWYPNATG